MLRQKPLVHRAVTFPKNDAAVVQSFSRIPAELFVRIPDHHLFKPQTQAIRSVSSEMLIWKEKNLAGPFQGPTHDRGSIG